MKTCEHASCAYKQRALCIAHFILSSYSSVAWGWSIERIVQSFRGCGSHCLVVHSLTPERVTDWLKKENREKKKRSHQTVQVHITVHKMFI